MPKAELNGHHLVKGTFIAPMNALPNLQLNDWVRDRMPEYFWLALILDAAPDRKVGLESCCKIIGHLVKNIRNDIIAPLITCILAMDEESQNLLYAYIERLGYKEALFPLTLFLRQSNFSCFANFFSNSLSVEERLKKCESVLKKCYQHNSDFSTDIRFVVVQALLLSKHLFLLDDSISVGALANYIGTDHTDEIMRMYRPTIRSLEGMALQLYKGPFLLRGSFWKELGNMTKCDLSSYSFDSSFDNLDREVSKIEAVISYYDELLNNAYMHNDKELVLFGLLTYSYTRFKEMADHDLFNEPSGRACIRAMIESYLISYYLLSKECDNNGIWRAYMEYGAGEYKLTAELIDELKIAGKYEHLDKDFILAFASREKDPMFTDMDVKYFTKLKMRDIARAAGEEELYVIYQHDSSFDHGLWCAVAECSLLHCNNVSHEYHRRLSLNSSKRLLPVYKDALSVIKKHIAMINKLYPIPAKVCNE